MPHKIISKSHYQKSIDDNEVLKVCDRIHDYSVETESIKITKILEEIIIFTRKLYKDQLDKIILFGSRARGDNHPNSDIDILIVLKHTFNYSQEIEKTSNFIAELSLQFDVVISRVFAETNDLQLQNTPFFLNVRKEGIIL
jgi:uncharacterized protein